MVLKRRLQDKDIEQELILDADAGAHTSENSPPPPHCLM
jgi:hypothetical protein